VHAVGDYVSTAVGRATLNLEPQAEQLADASPDEVLAVEGVGSKRLAAIERAVHHRDRGTGALAQSSSASCSRRTSTPTEARSRTVYVSKSSTAGAWRTLPSLSNREP